jgi:hypothetical protein
MSLFEQASLIVTPNATKAGKLYSIKPTSGAGDLTVTRATEATRVNSAGLIEVVANNVPRLDYTNGSCPSILVEPQRTNLILRSEEFDNAYYNKLNGNITPNVTTAPDGTLTADLFTKTSAINTGSGVQRDAPYTSTGTHTFSVFIKPNVGNLVLLRIDGAGNSANFSFNFTTKIFTNTGANAISSSFDELPNGWFRLKVVGNVTSVLWVLSVVSLFPNPINDSFFLWGADLEAGSNATSYIPTVASAVTRNADVISKTGIYTNNFISVNGGTWFVNLKDWKIGDSNTASISIADTSVSTNNTINIIGGTLRTRINSAVSNSYSTLPSRAKIAIKWDGTFINYFVNGVKVLTDGAFNITNMNFLNISGSNAIRNIENISLFPNPLTDQECINLTTI